MPGRCWRLTLTSQVELEGLEFVCAQESRMRSLHALRAREAKERTQARQPALSRLSRRFPMRLLARD